jgi:N-acetylneuraminic acid mutarotase
VVVDTEGRAFVDRDGDVFPFVLGYLHDGVVDLEGHDARMVRRVRKEFDYFNIELLVEDSCVFVAGGFVAGVSPVERYDAWGGGWAAVAPLPAPRRGLSLCALGGSLYTAGGSSLYTAGGSDSQRTSHAEVHAYDVANDTWRVVAPMGTARNFHGACSHGGHLYVVGGMDGDLRLSSGERYDPGSDTWSAITPLPGNRGRSGRSHFGMCSLGEFLYVAGGQGGMSSCFKYHPATNTWNPIPDLGTKRKAHCLCALGAFLYAISGSGRAATSMERYDPKTNSWSATALSVPQKWASCVVLDGRLHVLGGTTGQSRTQSVERYDATTNAWEVVSAMELPRSAMMSACSTVVQMNLFDKLLLERGRS